ncbi:unnamed protein product, partial [Rotaria sordida]
VEEQPTPTTPVVVTNEQPTSTPTPHQYSSHSQ